MPTRIPPVVALLFSLALLPGCDSGSDEVVLGVIGPFEQPWGKDMLLGARLAAEAVNASGGVDGRPLVLYEMDDRLDPGHAVVLLDSLLQHRPEVHAVVGPMTSGVAEDAATVYTHGLPGIATHATSPKLSGASDWMFRMVPHDLAIAGAGAEFASEQLGARRAAVLYSNDAYGRGLATVFRDAFREAGGEVIAMDPYREGMEEFGPYLQRLRDQEPDLVYIAGVSGSAAHIMKQARELGISVPVVGGDAITALQGGEVPMELYGVVAYHPESDTEANEEFARRFREAYGREPTPEAAPGYDAVRLFVQAIEEGAGSREEVREAIARLSAKRPFQGVAGPVSFDERNDPVGVPLQVVRVSAGGLERVAEVTVAR